MSAASNQEGGEGSDMDEPMASQGQVRTTSNMRWKFWLSDIGQSRASVQKSLETFWLIILWLEKQNWSSRCIHIFLFLQHMKNVSMASILKLSPPVVNICVSKAPTCRHFFLTCWPYVWCFKDSEAPQHNGRDESGRRHDEPQRNPLGYTGNQSRVNKGQTGNKASEALSRILW